MADFLDKLSAAIETHRPDLEARLRTDALPGEAALQRLVQEHWGPLPPPPPAADWAAYAVDGSVSQLDLDNGAYLVIVQALCLGEGAHEASAADVEILPPATPRPTAGRVADLLQQKLELYLAGETVDAAAPGSVVFLDGALYGRLAQLYALPPADLPTHGDLPETVLDNYLSLLEQAERRGVRLVAVSKTSREATHCRIWLRARSLRHDVPFELTDSEMIHRWTDRAAGVSAPVVLGTWGFTGGSRDLLDREDVRTSPAIVSLFTRLADFDDALRIDVPARQLGHDLRLGDLDGAPLDGGCAAARPVLDLLAADYGGLEVYNALLYSVDREVRLHRHVVTEVYLPLIEAQLGRPLRMDRSQRRF